jgi:arylsulfatase A-like enzyme
MAQWKGRVAGGKTYEQPVISLDMFATAAAAAGARPARALDGVNLLPHLTGAAKRPPHESLFWRYNRGLALRRGNLKLVRQGAPEFQLFDLGADIAETRDLAAEKPALARELEGELNRYNAQMVDALWGRTAMDH